VANISPVIDDSPQLDRRITRSRHAVENAMLYLLEDKRPFEEITISEVAEHAGVTRKTLYAHYSSTENIVRQISKTMLAEIGISLKDVHLQHPLDESVFGKKLLESAQKNAAKLRLLITCCPSEVFLGPVRDEIAVLIKRVRLINNVPELGAFATLCLIEIIGAATLGALTAWSRNDFKDPPQTMSHIYMTIVMDGFNRLMAEHIVEPER